MFNSVGLKTKRFSPQSNPANSILVAFRILAKDKPEAYPNHYLENVILWSIKNYERSDEVEAIHARLVLSRLARLMLTELPEEEAEEVHNMVSKWNTMIS